MTPSDRFYAGDCGGSGDLLSGSSSRSGSRTSQSYFRSPALILPNRDRSMTAADASVETVCAAPRGSPQSSAGTAVVAGGRLYGGGGDSDSSAAWRHRDSWHSDKLVGLPALSTLRTSPTAFVGCKTQCDSLTPSPTLTATGSSSLGMVTTAYGRRPPHLQAVSQSLVDAWILVRQRSGAAAAPSTAVVTGGGRPTISRTLGARLVVAQQVQRAIDMAESDRRTAAAADRTTHRLPPYRRLTAASTEPGTVGVARRELKYRNIFFNFGGANSSSSFDSDSEQQQASVTNCSADRSRHRETSSIAIGSSPIVKKRVRFMDALCWEVPTPLA